MQRLKYYQ